VAELVDALGSGSSVARR